MSVVSDEGHSSASNNALGEAALRMALGFSRPAIVAFRVALLAGSVELIFLSLGFWFLLYSTVDGFAPLVSVPFALCLAAFGVAANGVASRYLPKVMMTPTGMVTGAALAVYAPLVPLFLLFPDPNGVAQQFSAAVLVFLLIALPIRWVMRECVRWAVETGLTSRRAIIAGGNEKEAMRILRGLENNPDSDVKVCAFFDDRATDRVPELLFEVPKIGYFDDLIAFCQIAEIDLIILTLPMSAEKRIADLLDQMSVLPVAIHMSQLTRDFSFPDSRGVSIASSSFRAERRFTKRVFDLVVGSLALLALSPIMIATAIAIRWDSPGPIFFRQERHGFNNRVIRIWKFRSMYHDQSDFAAKKVVTRGDSRVTKVGRFIRKTSIDELPQLFNVLDGTLSLVGPRPHAVHAQSSQEEPFGLLVRNYSARHRLPPGITGLAQINGRRGEIAEAEQLEARVADDLRYIEGWSLWLDIWILLKTPRSLLNTRNAY